MLVLSRRAKEVLKVGNVTITVKKIGGNRVSLAIEAPKDVPILRGELESHDERKAA